MMKEGKGAKDTHVNRVRREVYNDCLRAAVLSAAAKPRTRNTTTTKSATAVKTVRAKKASAKRPAEKSKRARSGSTRAR
jgi:hypothetical protein